MYMYVGQILRKKTKQGQSTLRLLLVSLTVPGHCRELQNRDNVHVSISAISSYPTGVREVPSRNMHIYTTLIVYSAAFAENRLFIPCPYMARWCSRKNVASSTTGWGERIPWTCSSRLRGKDAISPAASTRVYADASLCCQRSQLAHSESEGDLERDGFVLDYAAFGGESSIH